MVPVPCLLDRQPNICVEINTFSQTHCIPAIY